MFLLAGCGFPQIFRHGYPKGQQCLAVTVARLIAVLPPTADTGMRNTEPIGNVLVRHPALMDYGYPVNHWRAPSASVLVAISYLPDLSLQNDVSALRCDQQRGNLRYLRACGYHD